MLIGLFFLKESPRWLTKRGRHADALNSLAHIRRADIGDQEVIHELAEIRAAVEEELHLTEGVTWKECLKPGIRSRFILAFVLMLCQQVRPRFVEMLIEMLTSCQFSGTNSIGYYAPEIFETVGVSKTNASLFATGELPKCVFRRTRAES